MRGASTRIRKTNQVRLRQSRRMLSLQIFKDDGANLEQNENFYKNILFISNGCKNWSQGLKIRVSLVQILVSAPKKN